VLFVVVNVVLHFSPLLELCVLMFRPAKKQLVAVPISVGVSSGGTLHLPLIRLSFVFERFACFVDCTFTEWIIVPSVITVWLVDTSLCSE